jgi:flagellar protein FlaG
MDSNTTSIPANANAATAASAVTTASGSVAKTAASVAAAKNQSTATTAAPKQDAELQRDPRSLQFQVDGNRVITTIIDKNDKTVVVQIPDADMIRIAKQIDRMQGFLIKAKA